MHAQGEVPKSAGVPALSFPMLRMIEGVGELTRVNPARYVSAMKPRHETPPGAALALGIPRQRQTFAVCERRCML